MSFRCPWRRATPRARRAAARGQGVAHRVMVRPAPWTQLSRRAAAPSARPPISTGSARGTRGAQCSPRAPFPRRANPPRHRAPFNRTGGVAGDAVASQPHADAAPTAPPSIAESWVDVVVQARRVPACHVACQVWALAAHPKASALTLRLQRHLRRRWRLPLICPMRALGQRGCLPRSRQQCAAGEAVRQTRCAACWTRCCVTTPS